MANTNTAAGIIAATNTSKATIDAQIVTKTLDTLNENAPKKKKCGIGGNIAASYDFNKSVLSAVYNPVGTITEIKS